MLDFRLRGRGFEPHRRHCVVFLSKNIYPSLVLVQPRKTHPFITERLLMGRKESNQTKTNERDFIMSLSDVKEADGRGLTLWLLSGPLRIPDFLCSGIQFLNC